YDALMGALQEQFAGMPVDKTEENVQARCRGNLLMAISNKKGHLVLTTGNKSEMAVGYATLYGAMAGGFAVLKDVSKTRVFALARYRNSIGQVSPPSVIERPPSAELAPDQKDETVCRPMTCSIRFLPPTSRKMPAPSRSSPAAMPGRTCSTFCVWWTSTNTSGGRRRSARASPPAALAVIGVIRLHRAGR